MGRAPFPALGISKSASGHASLQSRDFIKIGVGGTGCNYELIVQLNQYALQNDRSPFWSWMSFRKREALLFFLGGGG